MHTVGLALVASVIVSATSAAALGGDVFQGHSYVITPEPMSWQSARDYAQGLGGYLVSINSDQEHEWVAKTFVPQHTPTGVTEFWLGFTDQLAEGSWKWESGELVTFTQWISSQPNNDEASPTGEDYALAHVWTPGPYGWSDSASPSFEGPVSRYGVVEIGEPRCVGCLLYQGHKYYLTPEPLTWQDASAYAGSLNGYLVSINSDQEHEWVAKTFVPTYAPAAVTEFWLGFSDVVVEGVWTWASGEPVTYTQWNLGQPDNDSASPTGEDFAIAHVWTPGPYGWYDGASPLSGGRPHLRYGVVEAPPLLVDLNDDGHINGADLGILLGFWGPCSGLCLGDINGSGAVDGADLGLLLVSRVTKSRT